ncbi:MAG: 6-carboxytetrahydropterin synthase [Coleofasciculus sp. S288]|nr:6-carboxytetrahydropterin synthase [Coleofasciculus sp. S288]
MPKWKLSTEFTFDAAHFIRDYDGPCGRMHGHTYRVQIEATSSQLHASEYCPHPVMVADFRMLRWAKQDLLKGGLDHSANPSNLSWAEDHAAQIPTDVVKLLQPEWGTPDSYSLIFEYVLSHPEWRISLQTHKFTNIR